MAVDINKCISTVSYFFNKAKWKISDVRNSLRNHLLVSTQTKIEPEDIACFDESSISKQGDKFEFIGDTYAGAGKEIHNGYTILAVAAVSLKKKTKWIFDEIIYSNQDPKFRGKFIYVQRLLKRLFKLTKIALVVFDAGFKNKYILNYVLNQGKNFIIRALPEMVVWSKDKQKKQRFKDIKKMKGAEHFEFSVGGQKGWSITFYQGLINAWMSEIKQELIVVIIRRPGFRKPMILITNLSITSFNETLEVYQKYLNRWQIEILFQEIKELGLKSFRLRRKVAILKYITVIILVYTLLTYQLAWVNTQFLWQLILKKFLKVKRKITDLLLGGLKIFYELFFTKAITLKQLFNDQF